LIDRVPPAAGIALAGLVWFAAQPRTQGIQFTTLPGFAIERVVPAAKTDSYVAMTFDSQGRLFVSKEFEPPRWLLDNDGDGTFESEKVFSDKVKNCQGLWWDARTLYANCAPADEPAQGGGGAQGRSGLFRMEDTNGDDVADTFEQVTAYVGGIQEHGPHAIRRGPDGEMTVITGNNTFVPDDKIDPQSPLGGRESQFLPALPDGRGFGPSIKEGRHGVVSRYDRQAKHFTLMVGGLRNSYDYAFNLSGELFLFDSDMEWDINMPWYRDVRTVHGIPGGNYGYRNGSGKFPPYYIDSLPAVRDLGRGSPVGVEFYQHHVYPKQFHDAYFEADWSRGRLLWTALQPNGATYKAVEEKTEFVHGEPLNITDVETGPDGLIYFSTGGRGTEGGLYRVRYTGAGAGNASATPAGVLALVRQPQPLSSWGFAALEKAKTTMGAAFAGELEKLARDGAADGVDRAQAIYTLQRHGSAPSGDLLKALIADKNSDVRAAVVYVAGVQGVDAQGSGDAKTVAIAALKDAHPVVQRRAAEALVRMGLSADKPGFVPSADLYALLNSPDRFVRYAGRLALERTPRAEWQDKAAAETNILGAIEGGVALIETATTDEQLLPVFKKQLGLASKAGVSVDDKLRAIRALQLATIGMKTVPPELRSQTHAALIGQFPSRDERLNRQLALTLAWAGQPAAITRVLTAMPAGDTNQQLQMHYVYALRTMKDGWTHAQKEQVMDWYAKAITWRGGASFPGFINLLFDASLQTFTPEEKTLAYKKVPQFAPLTEEEVIAAAQRQAAQRAANQPQGAQAPGSAGAAQTAANRPPQPSAQVPAGPQRVAPPASARSRGTMAISREELAQELIFTPQRTPPSAEVGQQIFDKTCSTCHRFGAMGKDIGPDLTTLNSRFQKKDIVESILWPSKVISDQYDVTMVETKDGKSLAGFVVREDGGKLIMRTADEMGRSFEVPAANVKNRTKSPVSMMPEGLVDEFTVQQIAGLLKFLQAAPPPASR
jgi:putative heme-binding domain-containing protein